MQLPEWQLMWEDFVTTAADSVVGRAISKCLKTFYMRFLCRLPCVYCFCPECIPDEDPAVNLRWDEEAHVVLAPGPSSSAYSPPMLSNQATSSALSRMSVAPGSRISMAPSSPGNNRGKSRVTIAGGPNGLAVLTGEVGAVQ